MKCELCGHQDAPYTTNVEGSTMQLCEQCRSFGTVVKKQSPTPLVSKKAVPVQKNIASSPDRPVLLQEIVAEYGQRIKRAREKNTWTQEELAKKMNIKASLLHTIEAGKFELNISLARQFEKILRITLVEQQEQKKIDLPRSEGDSFTIGDFMKKR